MASSTTRTPRSDLIRKATSSRVDWSDQCRSSSTSSSGRLALSRPSSPRTSSSSWDTWTPSAAGSAAPPGSSSGSRRPRPRRAGPSTSASSVRAVVRASVRSASMSGASGRPSAPSSTQWPARTVNPESAACPASSVTRRVLPTPASPATIANPGSPSAARSSNAVSDAISSRRPTKTGLCIGWLILCTVPQPGRAREPGTGNTRISRLLVRGAARTEPGDMTTTTSSLVRERAAGAELQLVVAGYTVSYAMAPDHRRANG